MAAYVPKVAIIDDEEAIRDLYATILEPHFNVVIFDDPFEALKGISQQNDFDVIVSDINMPGLDGLQLMAGLKRNGVTAEVIAVTGYADKEAAMRILKIGGFGILEKPIHRTALEHQVQRAAISHHLQDHNRKLVSFFSELFRRLESTDKVEVYLHDVKEYVEKLLQIQYDLEAIKIRLENEDDSAA